MPDKKTINGLLTVAFVGVAVAAVYYKATHTKRAYAKYIVQMNAHSNLVGLMSMEEKYLQKWSKALHKTQATFVYNGATYNTVGGKKMTV